MQHNELSDVTCQSPFLYHIDVMFPLVPHTCMYVCTHLCMLACFRCSYSAMIELEEVIFESVLISVAKAKTTTGSRTVSLHKQVEYALPYPNSRLVRTYTLNFPLQLPTITKPQVFLSCVFNIRLPNSIL